MGKGKFFSALLARPIKTNIISNIKDVYNYFSLPQCQLKSPSFHSFSNAQIFSSAPD